MYWTCPYCKANLDIGEKCDCKESDETFHFLDCDREARHGDDNKQQKET